MYLVSNVVVNIYSIAILIIIYILSLKQEEKESLQNKIYKRIIQITMIMLVIDILSRFDGNPGTIYSAINHFGNFMIFLLNPVVPSLWLLYVHDQVYHKEEKTRQLSYPILAINLLNIVVLVLTQFFGWYYYIDSDNIYHRGNLFGLAVTITMMLVLVTFAFIIFNREKIDNKHYFALVFFAIPPTLCIILQAMFYGISIILNGIVLSLLIVFLNIQNQNIYTDYLTGINNRKNLEIYLKTRINSCTENKTFSAIMLDLNNFKTINDTFGHDMGDNALQITATLLESCLGSNDFIARYGGDEFCIVLDASNRISLEKIICRINSCIEKYNESSEQPYKLGLSMGYAVYDYHSYMDTEEFQKQIDTMMYENKKTNRELNRYYTGVCDESL